MLYLSLSLSHTHTLLNQVPLIVARYAGQPRDVLRSKVEAAVRVHQKNELSVAASLALAQVLDRLVCRGR